MADITSSVELDGFGLDISRPFQWHVGKITIATGVLTDSQVDDIILPVDFPVGTYLLDAALQTLATVTNGSTCTADLEIARKTISSGALDQKANIVAGHDLETLDTTYAGTGTTQANWYDASNGLTLGTHVGALNVEITPGGAFSDDTLTLLVGYLVGRIDEP